MTSLIREKFQLKQTIVTITAQKKKHLDVAKEEIRFQRMLLEAFIKRDPFFLVTLEPYDSSLDGAPEIIKAMVNASATMEIGPMSTVAGTISEFALRAMIKAGATHAIVDNGGDIALINDRTVLMGIYAGSSPIKDLALEIPPRTEILGVCTSSGRVGPSISFGCADAVIVISKNVSLADAGATALGNAVSEEGTLKDCFGVVGKIGVEGALIIRAGEIALWGHLPKIKRAPLRPDLITKA